MANVIYEYYPDGNDSFADISAYRVNGKLVFAANYEEIADDPVVLLEAAMEAVLSALGIELKQVFESSYEIDDDGEVLNNEELRNALNTEKF